VETAFQSALLSPAALSTGVILLLAYLANYIFQQQKKDGKPFMLLDAPLLGNSKSMDFREAIATGFKNYTSKNKPFVINSTHLPTVILPIKYLNELKSLPESTLSFHGAFYSRFQGKYVGISTTPNHTLVQSVKVDLTRNISHVLSMLQDEMEYAAQDAIGPCEDWTPIPIYAKLLRIVALISGRAFVGLPLCRDERWIHISINYTIDFFAAPRRFWAYRSWQRPFVAPFLKEVRKVKQYKEEAKKLLTPIVEKRLREMEILGDDAKKNDMIQWAIDNAGDKKRDMDHMAKTYLEVSMAAIHTTSMNVTQVLYDLTSRPEYIEPLREEIAAVLAADNGKLIKTSMTKLRKLDSFIKETQRMNPHSLVQMSREVLKPITLSDGTILPKGLQISLPSHQVNMDENIWERPDEFDGFRFEKMRETPGNENRFQFVTTGADNINFGHGLHACPGRFFASNEIKVLLVHLLLNYDIKMMDGEKSRPENVYKQLSIIPDGRTRLCFKKRQL